MKKIFNIVLFVFVLFLISGLASAVSATTIAKVVTVLTGPLATDVTGNYVQAGVINGYPSYVREDNLYTILLSTGLSSWIIIDTGSSDSSYYFASGNTGNVNGAYSGNEGPNSGTGVLVADPVPPAHKTVTIAEGTTPDVSGDYVQIADINGNPAYQNGNYYIWFNTGDAWYITADGTGPAFDDTGFSNPGDGPDGGYAGYGTGFVGTATVADYVPVVPVAYTWTGTTGVDLSDRTNYSPNGTPTSADTLTIPGSIGGSWPESGTCDAGTVNINNGGETDGGTFSGAFTNSGGTIYDGTFSGSVTNYNGYIEGGIFSGAVNNNDGVIDHGTFGGNVSNQFTSTINGGTFSGSVFNNEGSDIGGGIFSGTVTNYTESITGGTFSYAINFGNSTTISNSDITGATLTADGVVVTIDPTDTYDFTTKFNAINEGSFVGVVSKFAPLNSKVVTVGGGTSPDVSGTYIPNGLVNGRPSYRRTDGAYYIWVENDDVLSIITSASDFSTLSYNNAFLVGHGPNANGNYSSYGSYTGTATVSDYAEWTVPHLSTQTFEIILISKAFQLDANQNIIADIYSQTQAKDNNWASLTDGQYARVTFYKTLTNKNDNTIYARPTNSSSPVNIEVYPVYTDKDGNQNDGPKVATFTNINHEAQYKVLLTNLATSTDVFDLKIIGNIDIDYIVDPDADIPAHCGEISGVCAFDNENDCTIDNQPGMCIWDNGSSTCSDNPTYFEETCTGTTALTCQGYGCEWKDTTCTYGISTPARCLFNNSGCFANNNENDCTIENQPGMCLWNSDTSTCSDNPEYATNCTSLTNLFDCKQNNACGWQDSICATSTIAKVVTVSEGTSPDVSGSYVRIADYNGEPAYQREDGAYNIWYYGAAFSMWVITATTAGTVPQDGWFTNPDESVNSSNYAAQGDPYTGTATVSDYVSPISYTWTGATSGDLSDPTNYSPNGTPTSADTLTIPGSVDSGNWPTSGTCAATVTVAGTGIINGGTFSGAVTNNGYIDLDEFDDANFEFDGAVSNNNSINGGTFTNTSVVTNNAGGNIGGGTFFGLVINNSNNLGEYQCIEAGTFNGLVDNTNGLITGGTFNGNDASHPILGTIEVVVSSIYTLGGTSYFGDATHGITVDATDGFGNSASITSGNYVGAVTNNGIINGGTYYQFVTNDSGDIETGNYCQTQIGTNGVINGGTFHINNPLCYNYPVKTVTIAEGTTPDVSGNYYRIADYNGYPAYQRTDGAYVIWDDDLNDYDRISGPPVGEHFSNSFLNSTASGPGVADGNYAAGISYSGTATVSDYVAPAVSITSPTNQSYSSSTFAPAFTCSAGSCASGAGSCKYSYDGTTYININCSNLGSDILAPSSGGSNTLYVKASDTDGNWGTASTATFTYNNVALAVTINQASGQADPTNVSPINFTVVFSESVSDFATGDVSLSGTASPTTATVTGSGTTYNVAVSGMTGQGTVVASINYNGTGSTSTDNSVTYDTVPPSLSFTDNVEAGPVTSDTITANWGDAMLTKWDYSATSTCSTNASDYLNVTSLITTQATTANNGKYICLYAEDSLGNKSTLASAYAINIGSTPVVSYGGGGGGGVSYYTIVASVGTNGSISPNGSASLTYGGSQTYTITPATGYQVADVLVDNVSKGAITTYTFSSVTGNHTISATFSIAAGALPISSTVDLTNSASIKKEIQRLQALIQEMLAQQNGASQTSSQFTFTKNLKLGDTNSDVKILQQELNKLGFVVANYGKGSLGNESNYFGLLTKLAVIKFQEKYASEILTPLGLKSGTGILGNLTRQKLNSLLTK